MEYKIIRPEYLTPDTSIYKHAISIIDTKLKAQEIIYNWELFLCIMSIFPIFGRNTLVFKLFGNREKGI